MRNLKKSMLVALTLALCLACQLPAAAADEDFLIQDGVLVSYDCFLLGTL